MNKVVLLTLIGTLAVTTGGCSFLTDLGNEQNRLSENQTQSTPAKNDSIQAQLDSTTEDFADLELEKSETKSLPEIAGLIPATDPEARVRTSIRGRNDPFSTVALNPRIEIKKEKVKEEIKQVQKEQKQKLNPVVNRENHSRRASTISNSDKVDVSTPPSAEPDLANNVVVSGLYKANGTTKIIVKVPEETTSRYVEVGQYLSDGQVLVKGVDRNSPSSSTVILEQSGTEVRKTIGEDMTSGDNLSALPTTLSHDWNSAISLR